MFECRDELVDPAFCIRVSEKTTLLGNLVNRGNLLPDKLPSTAYLLRGIWIAPLFLRWTAVLSDQHCSNGRGRDHPNPVGKYTPTINELEHRIVGLLGSVLLVDRYR
jgi:hypothetical protein